jgi:S1-C subfamily serine protease
MTRRFGFVLVLLACFTAGVLLANRFRSSAEAVAETPSQSPQSRPSITTPGPVGAGGTLTDFTRIAERTIPAVVNVSAQQVVRRRVPIDPFFSKQGAGTLLRIQVVGTSKEPKFGRDRGKATGTN